MKKIKVCGSSILKEIVPEKECEADFEALWHSVFAIPEKLWEKKADYFILDLAYSTERPVCLLGDEWYTKNKRFVQTEVYTSQKEKFRTVDFLKEKDAEWKSRMDFFIGKLLSVYAPEQIILIRMGCPEWYITHSHVRKWNKKERACYNERLLEFEEYFIGRVNPCVIDVAKYYYTDFNHSDGFSMTSFEPGFGKQVRKHICEWLDGKQEVRVFQSFDYEILIERFVRYYDHLYAKKNTGLFFVPGHPAEDLILALNKNLIRKFKKQFITIHEMKEDTLREVYEQYDFSGQEEFQSFFELVMAVKERDYFREGISYGRIFRRDLKILDEMLPDIQRMYFHSRLWTDIHDIHKGNAELLYRLFCSYKKEDKAAFTHRLFRKTKEFLIEHQGKGKISAALAMKKIYRGKEEDYHQMLEAYFNLTKPIAINLWGSCISREILNEDKGRIRLEKYAYRNSFLFAFDEPVPHEESMFEDLSLFENRRWRMEYIQNAFLKNLPETLVKNNAEWLVLDFYDLICDSISYQGHYFTGDSEVRSLGFYKKIESQCEVFHLYEKEDAFIRERMDRFIRFAKENYSKRVILISTDVKTYFLDYLRSLKPMRGQDYAHVLRCKEFISKWQDYFVQQTHCHVIDIAKYYFADDCCVSGATMVHYEKGFYEVGYQMLLDTLEGKSRKEVQRDLDKKEIRVKNQKILAKNAELPPEVWEENVRG